MCRAAGIANGIENSIIPITTKSCSRSKLIWVAAVLLLSAVWRRPVMRRFWVDPKQCLPLVNRY